MSSSHKNGHKLPHSLRMVILLLRVAVGLDFFYLGFGTLFNPSVGAELKQQSFADVYSWLSSPANTGWIHTIAPWAFIIIGTCLCIGFATRLASLFGMALILTNYLPTINFAKVNALHVVNNEVIILLSLLVIFFGKAGLYFGMDRFFHFSFRRKQ